MKNLKEDIKLKIFKPVYLLYGDEGFLLNYYTKALLDAAVPEDNRMMNHSVFNGKNVSARQIIDAANTFPMSGGYRFVTVKDSGLFAVKKKGGDEARKDDAEEIVNYLKEIPSSIVLLFAEPDADKRSRLYKQVEKNGRAVACVKPSPSELSKWLQSVFKKQGKSISPAAATALIRAVSGGMNPLLNEADKLAAYAGGRAEITKEDIAAVVSPTLESRVFDLVAASAEGRKTEALRFYKNMILLKESPFMILNMIVRQYRMILLCKAAQEKNMRRYEIIQELGIRDFAVDECLSQGRRYTKTQIVSALQACRDMEVRIKSGLMDAETGVEMLAVKGLD